MDQSNRLDTITEQHEQESQRSERDGTSVASNLDRLGHSTDKLHHPTAESSKSSCDGGEATVFIGASSPPPEPDAQKAGSSVGGPAECLPLPPELSPSDPTSTSAAAAVLADQRTPPPQTQQQPLATTSPQQLPSPQQQQPPPLSLPLHSSPPNSSLPAAEQAKGQGVQQPTSPAIPKSALQMRLAQSRSGSLSIGSTSSSHGQEAVLPVQQAAAVTASGSINPPNNRGGRRNSLSSQQSSPVTSASQTSPQPQQQQQPQQQPQQQQQAMVPVSVLHALLSHPVIASLSPTDLQQLIHNTSSAATQPPLLPLQQPLTQPIPQHQHFSQQHYAQQLWILQQQAAQQQQQFQHHQHQNQQQQRLPFHLRNLHAHHSERAAQVIQGGGDAAGSPGSAVASYMDQLSEAGGDDAYALPVGESLPLPTPLRAPSSYTPSDMAMMYDFGGMEQSTSQPMPHGTHMASRSAAAGQAAAHIVQRVGNMTRPPTLNFLQQAEDDYHMANQGEDNQSTPSEATGEPSRAESIRSSHQAPHRMAPPSQATSQAPSQAGGGGTAHMSVAAMFGNFASEQMEMLKKTGCTVGGVPPDEDEALMRRKEAARKREKARRIDLERERLGLPPRSSGTSKPPSQPQSPAIRLGKRTTLRPSAEFESELGQGPTRQHSQRPSMLTPQASVRHSNAFQGQRRRTFGREIGTGDLNTGTTVAPSVAPSVPMSKMASQDMTALVNEMKLNQGDQNAAGPTAFVSREAASALAAALQSDSDNPGSLAQPSSSHPNKQASPSEISRGQSHVSRMPDLDGSKGQTAGRVQGQDTQTGEIGESLGQQFNIDMSKLDGRVGEMGMANDGPAWLRQAAESTPSEKSGHPEDLERPLDEPVLFEGEVLLDEHGEPIDEEEAKRLRDEALMKPGAAQEQLEGIGLFANPDDDDDEMKKHDLQRALVQKQVPWYKTKYWRILIGTNSVTLFLIIVGVVLQEKVRGEEGIDTEAFRWVYFFAFCPPFWYCTDLSIHYLFSYMEWRFFANSLLYFKNLVRHTVVFVFLTLLLLWHSAMFEWAWCHDDSRCEGDDYVKAVDITRRVHICLILFSLANLAKASFAKMLSTHFYKTAHFQKLEQALEKEYFLQLLSKPQRKVLARKIHIEQVQHAKQEAQMRRDLSHQAHLETMNRVKDKVKDFAAKDRSVHKPQPQEGGAQEGSTQPLQRSSHAPGWTPSFLRRPGHRRAASADTSKAMALAAAHEGALPLTMESIQLLQSINQDPCIKPPNADNGEPFPAGAQHIVGGGASGAPFIPSQMGSPNNATQAQADLQGHQPRRESISAPIHMDSSQGEAAPFLPVPYLMNSVTQQPPHTYFWQGGNRELGQQQQQQQQQQAQADCSNRTSSSPFFLQATAAPPVNPPISFAPPQPPAAPSPPNPSPGLPPLPPNINLPASAALQTASSDAALNASTPTAHISRQFSSASTGATSRSTAVDQNSQEREGPDNNQPSQQDRSAPTDGFPAYATVGQHGFTINPVHTLADELGKLPVINESRGGNDSMPARVTDTGLEGSGGGNTGGSRAAASRRGRTSNSRSYLPSHGQSRENLVQEVREGSSLRRDSQRIERASHPLDEAILDGMLPVPEALKDEPAKLKKKKDLAQLTEDELEKMRTAVVVKTYTAIIRNYNTMTVEEQEEEMARVRAFSRALFYNIKGDEDREHVSLEDFELFFSDRKMAAKAFAVFDADGDNTVSRREIKEGVVSIYKERANMASSLKDTDSIVSSLETAIGGVIHFIFVAFYLLIWNVSLVEGFSTFSATLLAFTFIFGNAVRNMFEAMLFLFVEHAYDVGDNILLNSEIHRIKKITLLYTEMITLNGERIFYPNSGLVNSVIRNWSRSRTFTEFIFFHADVGVTPFVLQDTMASMLEHAKACPTEYDDVPFLQFFALANPMKVVILLTFTYAFAPDDWKRLVPARNAMFGIVQAKFAEHQLRCSVMHIERRLPNDHLPGGQPMY